MMSLYALPERLVQFFVHFLGQADSLLENNVVDLDVQNHLRVDAEVDQNVEDVLERQLPTGVTVISQEINQSLKKISYFSILFLATSQVEKLPINIFGVNCENLETLLTIFRFKLANPSNIYGPDYFPKPLFMPKD
jgi:hypothetical protein